MITIIDIDRNEEVAVLADDFSIQRASAEFEVVYNHIPEQIPLRVPVRPTGNVECVMEITQVGRDNDLYLWALDEWLVSKGYAIQRTLTASAGKANG